MGAQARVLTGAKHQNEDMTQHLMQEEYLTSAHVVGDAELDLWRGRGIDALKKAKVLSRYGNSAEAIWLHLSLLERVNAAAAPQVQLSVSHHMGAGEVLLLHQVLRHVLVLVLGTCEHPCLRPHDPVGDGRARRPGLAHRQLLQRRLSKRSDVVVHSTRTAQRSAAHPYNTAQCAAGMTGSSCGLLVCG
jgi:hypothetical protein